MIVLGIHGNIIDQNGLVNESSASIVIDGKIVACVSEERISRKKVDGRFPHLAINEVLKIANLNINDVDHLAVSCLNPFETSKKYLESAFITLKDTGVVLKNKILDFSWFTIYNKLKLNKVFDLALLGKTFTVNFNDHHYCHAAGAYYASPFENALVITLDGGGDGLDGGAYIGEGSTLERFIEIPHFQSPGTMYSAITHDLGFKRHRHEGKITGLAAYGNSDSKRLGLDKLLNYEFKKHRFISKSVASHHKNLLSKSNYFYPLLKHFPKEDLAAVTQSIFEKSILDFVNDAINIAKIKGKKVENLCLAGGCFANVKANQKLFKSGNFKDIFVFPAMGDDGLSPGAALLTYYKKSKVSSKKNSCILDTYLGGKFTNEEIEEVILGFNIKYSKLKKIEDKVGELLAEGNIVARFNGRMEYGPRSLGNRSILGAPFDPEINDWLNKKLNRTEFMPFAPSILFENANKYLVDFVSEKAADFMTITYDIKEGMKEKIPAVVHVDNTARPQIVRKNINESFHKIINAFYKRTGIPVVLNTSFNMHEEPIVYTPNDAIKSFLNGKLDYLAIGNFLIKHPEVF